MINPRFHIGLMLVVFVFGLVSGLHRAAAAEKPVESDKQQIQTAAVTPDEAAIRASAAAAEKAFNSGDAKAVSAHWAEDGEYVNENGQRFTGRAAIQQEYEKFFAEYPGVQIKTKVDRVKMLSPETAITEGTTTLGGPDAASPISSHYMAVRVKQDGQWLIVSAHEMRTEDTTDFGDIADLEGLIGTWQYNKGTTSVETMCRWIADNKFVERTFSVMENGKVTQTGKQIIGLEPSTQQITSWSFDSTGAHDVGGWIRQDNGWIIQSTGALGDGTPTSAVNQLKHVDNDSIAWKSVNRTAGGKKLSDAAEVLLKRVSNTGVGK